MKSNGSFEDAISGEPILAASSGSWDQNDVLMLLRQDSSQPEDHNPNSSKKNPGLLKGKFKAAIKSLQCSPRVEGDSHGKQKGKHNNHKKNNTMLPPVSTTTTTEPLNYSPQQQPVFIANFDEFETMNQIANTPVHVETGSVSSALELEKVLDRLDSRDASKNDDIILNHDNLEIFTNNTNDTDDTYDNNNDDEDKKSDVIQDLWNVSDPPLQFDDQNEQDNLNPTQINASAFPLSEWESPPSPKPLIHKELSQYSQDSNDTPRTCNKSLILTPKNQERLSIESSSENNEDLFGKPPKELFHRSLSLGDSLSPTDDDSPPCRSSGNFSGESHPNTQQQQQQHQKYQYQSLDTLNLPAMDAKRHSTDKNKTLMVQHTEKMNSRRHSADNKNLMVQPMEENVATTRDRSNSNSNSNSPQSDGSPLSSTVSSFVFSTADGNQAKQQQRRRVVSPEATSPGFFWKTHPKGDDQRQPPAPQHSKPEIPTSPSFFWKTHPRVTIKSYHYQNVPVRRVNSKLGTGLHLAEVATS